MKKTFSILCLLLCTFYLSAQELKCTVTINSDKVEGSSKQVFNTLKTSIEEYMNQNRWTNMTFAEHEKIECSMLIVVNKVENNLYTCEMTLQSRRPVYGTTYTTPLLNFKDKAFNFTYQEYDRIEYQQNQFTTNLTAMLAFYCYLILGHDMDSYQRLGGTPFFQQCEDIVNACQSASMENTEQTGWRAFESNRSRYAITNNLMDEAFRKYREFYYTYHRLGLDEMASNVTNGRNRIAEGLPVLREAYRARPATYVINTFLDAKAEELVDIFKRGTDKEKKNVQEILMDIDPTRQNTYDKITQN
ncbi:MAG: DUF4835 family protein [Paludibacteraceae bacterium]|nr:DUF4835 family protein [Paludibacteraceae bacterium]